MSPLDGGTSAAGPTEESPHLSPDRVDEVRRTLLARLVGLAGAGLATVLPAPPASADPALDIRILQTASSLEALALLLYGLILGEGSEGATAPGSALAGAPAVAAFARETRRRHAEHLKAFQSRTLALGGRAQDAPHPGYRALVDRADLSTPASVVNVAATLEKVATDTYLSNLALLHDPSTKAAMAGVMAVEAQHLATMRMVGALLAGPPPFAVPLPVADLSRLPSSIARAPFPDALHAVSGPEGVAGPASGAVR